LATVDSLMGDTTRRQNEEITGQAGQ